MFQNYLSEQFVMRNGAKAVYSAGTLQKKMAILSRATALGKVLIDDGDYLNNLAKTDMENMIASNLRTRKLESAKAECRTHISVQQKYVDAEKDHRRYNMAEMLKDGTFMTREMYVDVLGAIIDDTEALFKRMRVHMRSAMESMSAPESKELLEDTSRNMLSIVALACSMARPEDLCHLKYSALECAAVETSSPVPHLSDDDTFTRMRLDVTKNSGGKQVLFVHRRVFALFRAYADTTRSVIIQRYGYNSVGTDDNTTSLSRQVHPIPTANAPSLVSHLNPTIPL